MLLCATAKEIGGRKFHRESPEVGIVDEVEASHLTAPYCAVKVGLVIWIVEPDRVPSVNDAVGAFVNPVVLHPLNDDPAQKLFVTVGVIVFEPLLY